MILTRQKEDRDRVAKCECYRIAASEVRDLQRNQPSAFVCILVDSLLSCSAPGYISREGAIRSLQILSFVDGDTAIVTAKLLNSLRSREPPSESLLGCHLQELCRVAINVDVLKRQMEEESCNVSWELDVCNQPCGVISKEARCNLVPVG